MFTKADEGAIWRNDFNRYAWHPALKAAGVAPGRENGFHQLRHHFASIVLRDGVDIRDTRRVPRPLRPRFHAPGVLPPDAGLAGQGAAGDRPGVQRVPGSPRDRPGG